MSRSGTRQGDPLGAQFFALGLHPVLCLVASLLDKRGIGCSSPTAMTSTYFAHRPSPTKSSCSSLLPPPTSFQSHLQPTFKTPRSSQWALSSARANSLSSVPPSPIRLLACEPLLFFGPPSAFSATLGFLPSRKKPMPSCGEMGRPSQPATLSLAAPLALMPTLRMSFEPRPRRPLPSFPFSTASFSRRTPDPMLRMSAISLSASASGLACVTSFALFDLA